MPKLYNKQQALRFIYRFGDLLAKHHVKEKGPEFIMGAAEYKHFWQKIAPNTRQRDIVSTAIQHFANQVIETPRWVLEILDHNKPILRFRLKGEKSAKH